MRISISKVVKVPILLNLIVQSMDFTEFQATIKVQIGILVDVEQ